MLNKNKTGLSLGVFMIVVHFLWSAAVLLGLGKKFINWAFEVHYLTNPFGLVGITFVRFLGLMIMTFVGGYVIGWIFAFVWNKIYKQ